LKRNQQLNPSRFCFWFYRYNNSNKSDNDGGIQPAHDAQADLAQRPVVTFAAVRRCAGSSAIFSISFELDRLFWKSGSSSDKRPPLPTAVAAVATTAATSPHATTAACCFTEWS
jgi:hypothetical protein